MLVGDVVRELNGKASSPRRGPFEVLTAEFVMPGDELTLGLTRTLERHMEDATREPWRSFRQTRLACWAERRSIMRRGGKRTSSTRSRAALAGRTMRSAEGLGSCSDDARGLSALCGFVLLRSRHSSASKVFSRHPSCLNSEIRIRVTLRTVVAF